MPGRAGTPATPPPRARCTHASSPRKQRGRHDSPSNPADDGAHGALPSHAHPEAQITSNPVLIEADVR